MVSTLDHLSEGRLIFGVGIGGEFPREYEACGVPVNERGPRLSEAIPLMRALLSGETVDHQGRYYPSFGGLALQPPARQPGGPPIWVGGRADPALARAGRLADGWISYVITPETFRAGLEKIAQAAQKAGRKVERFGTGHLLFTRLDDSYEQALEAAAATLSRRYGSDMRRAAERYGALGRAEQVAERIRAFHAAGVRHLSIDLLGPYEERPEHIDRFAREVLPLVADLRAA
jgi:alkanesulfonate monooxygenase SsuD/methylene tetrahydromethanopterin reductase-like flavin-dependent oxidoreductase (luciferase family)